jgi:membrane-bound lytic murein transglycosylase D
LIRAADRQFADGKREMQEGKIAEARKSFDRTIQILMSQPLPADAAERRRLEEHLADLTDAIYHYDLEQLGSGAGDPTSEAATITSIEKQILEETLPVNPVLRQKVLEQIETTMSELPLEVTDAVVSYIDYFSTDRGRRVLLSGFARSGQYREMIHRALAGSGLPEELIFVAQLESHFNPVAVSYASAVGMWQFMSYTAPDYSLAINNLVDERRDPEKATSAASKYLLDLYHHYGDWYLALAAYNCGPGCVDRAIQRTGYADFWELRRLHVLPLATTNYVPEVLAMTIMYKNADAYGIEVQEDPTVEYDNFEIEADTNLALVAAATDRPVGQIKQLNPALLQDVAPRGYSLHLPVGFVYVVQTALEIVPPEQRRTGRIHRVDESDTWASIAKEYATTTAKLETLNPGGLPGPGAFAAIPPLPPPAPKAPKKKSSKSAKAPSKTSTSASAIKSPSAQSRSTAKR